MYQEEEYEEPRWLQWKNKQSTSRQPSQSKTVHAPKIEVNYWAPRVGTNETRGGKKRSPTLEVGHLTLRIIDDEEDIYISNWPKGLMRTFLLDCEEEGRSPDEYINIPPEKVYVDKVKNWWKWFVDRRTRLNREQYNFIINNCAQIVYKALRAGSFPHYFLLRSPPLTPYEVKEWIKSYGCESRTG